MVNLIKVKNFNKSTILSIASPLENKIIPKSDKQYDEVFELLEIITK